MKERQQVIEWTSLIRLAITQFYMLLMRLKACFNPSDTSLQANGIIHLKIKILTFFSELRLKIWFVPHARVLHDSSEYSAWVL